jgi:hypothetical protein
LTRRTITDAYFDSLMLLNVYCDDKLKSNSLMEIIYGLELRRRELLNRHSHTNVERPNRALKTQGHRQIQANLLIETVQGRGGLVSLG